MVTMILQSLTTSKTAGHRHGPFERIFTKHHDELLLPLNFYHFIGRVVVLCWMAFVCVVPYARWVCLGRIMGRTGRCFPLGHDGGGRLLRYCLSFFLFVCFVFVLFYRIVVAGIWSRVY